MPPTEIQALKAQIEAHEDKDESRHLETLQALTVLKEKMVGVEGHLSLITDRGFKIFCVVLAVALLGGPVTSSLLERFFPLAGAHE